MPHATCLRCTRIFLGPFGEGDLLPPHLDALLGFPCPAAGTLAPIGPGLPFDLPWHGLPATEPGTDPAFPSWSGDGPDAGVR